MITLYFCSSPNVMKVVIALEELALDYRLEPVDVISGEQFSAAFGALTPNRKLPVILDDEHVDGDAEPFVLWESGAILIYLAEKCGALLPQPPRARMVALQWLMFQMSGIGPMFGQHTHFRVYAPESEHQYSRDRYATEMRRIHDVVEQRLSESQFLAGSDYSIADIAAWPWLHRAAMRGIDLAELPSTSRWIEEIAVRPAVLRAKHLIDPILAVDQKRHLGEPADTLDRYLMRGRYSRPIT